MPAGPWLLSLSRQCEMHCTIPLHTTIHPVGTSAKEEFYSNSITTSQAALTACWVTEATLLQHHINPAVYPQLTTVSQSRPDSRPYFQQWYHQHSKGESAETIIPVYICPLGADVISALTQTFPESLLNHHIAYSYPLQQDLSSISLSLREKQVLENWKQPKKVLALQICLFPKPQTMLFFTRHVACLVSAGSADFTSGIIYWRMNPRTVFCLFFICGTHIFR